MLINLIRCFVGVIFAFFLQGVMGVATQQMFRGQMLTAAGWQPGQAPPAGYVWATLATDLVGGLIAGFALGLISGGWARMAATIAISITAGLRLFQYVSSLEDNPHWYAAVLIVLPVVSIPAGVWVAHRTRIREVKEKV